MSAATRRVLVVTAAALALAMALHAQVRGYRIGNLPPGDYFLSAMTDVETGEWFDPEFLQALVVAAPITITIRDGDTLRHDLRIGR